MKVLDAGCGVGGGAMYIAKETGAKVTGITVSPKQVERARLGVKERGLDGMVEIIGCDYLRTPFEDRSFDVVYAIESACHAYPKQKFVK